MKFVEDFDKAVAKEIAQFYVMGGTVGVATHPAARWAPVLVEFSQAHPGTPAATEAIARAMWMLQHAGLNEQMFTLAERIPACDASWERILEPLSYAADVSDREVQLIRKTLALQAQCIDPAEQATAAYTRAIVFRRRGEIDQARAALQQALKQKTDAPALRKAERLLFEINSLNLGQVAPTFFAKTIDDKFVQLRDFRGNVVLLNFWSSTCSPCVEEISSLHELQSSYGGKGLVILGISADVDRRMLRDMVAAQHIDWAQICNGKGFDGEVFVLFNILGTPTNIVIDRDGKIIFKDFGLTRERDMRSAINDAINGRQQNH